jgi:hypothetical protein
LHEPFQRFSTQRHLWAMTVALIGDAPLPIPVAFVGGATALEGPAKATAAAIVRTPRIARIN